jgi:Na+-translocating ferredoxin:NAD+ oxidoreductase RnfG subunit
MKRSLCLILIGINIISAADIRSDVEDIIKTEFISNFEVSLEKYDIPGEVKASVETQVNQKFFKDYIYVWRICQGDSIAGIAILDNTYGKSLPITFLVIIHPTGKIRRIDIIRYREPYGGAIGSRRWLDQFIGKSANDNFKIDEEIDSISGATISVQSVTKAIHKLLIMIDPHLLNDTIACKQNHHQVKSKAK